MKAFEYFEPKTVEEAVSLLGQCGGDAKILAGGTNLVPAMKAGGLQPKCVVNIKFIQGLDELHEDGEGIHIGALVHLAEMAAIKTPRRRKIAASLVEKLPISLRQMISLMANPQIRNIATIPGNLAFGSPAADSAPPLLALDAQLKVAGPGGEKVIALDDFFKGPGQTALAGDEVISEVLIPDASLHKKNASLKLMKRKANTLAVCSAAVSFNNGNGLSDVRIAAGAVAPVPLRLKKAEALLEGQTPDDELLAQVKAAVAEEISPITDLRSTAWYRQEVTPVLVERCIRQAMA